MVAQSQSITHTSQDGAWWDLTPLLPKPGKEFQGKASIWTALKTADMEADTWFRWMLTCSVSLPAMPRSCPVPYCKEKASPPCSYESDRKDLNFWCSPTQKNDTCAPRGDLDNTPSLQCTTSQDTGEADFWLSYKEGVDGGAHSPAGTPVFLYLRSYLAF